MTSKRITFFTLVIMFVNSAGAADQFAQREPRYRLHPGNTLRVSYRLTPEYDATVEIHPDGFVTLPLLGDLKAGGLSLPEIRAAVEAKASERLNNPEITVDLKGFDAPHYIVGGEVGSPGRFFITDRVTALRAIQMAGGFKTSAKASEVLLIRPIDDVDAQTKVINLKKVVDKKQLSEDVELHPGDLLIVPKNRLAKIEPIVKLANFGTYINPTGF